MSPGSKGESSKAIIERPGQRNWRETTMEASSLVLSLVKEAAAFAPIQHLQQAASAALIIFQTIQVLTLPLMSPGLNFLSVGIEGK